AAEAGLAAPAVAYAVASLREAAQLLATLQAGGSRAVPPGALCAALVPATPLMPPAAAAPLAATSGAAPALSEVIGQAQAKRALQIAAAGGHGMLLIGPPGSGKSMLAARLPGLLPAMSHGEAFEVASIRAAAGLAADPQGFCERPFRCPHHTSSVQAIVGGGAQLRPGEISLAHHGVLFLDELPEFDRRVLEALREPLESGRIGLARATQRLELPARFQLIAAMNPCPCGYLGDARVDCRCSKSRIEHYRQRLSGPLLDRIDIRVCVERLPVGALLQVAGAAEAADATEDRAAEQNVRREQDDAAVRRRIQLARQWRLERSGALNACLSGAGLRRCSQLSLEARRLLLRSCQRWTISGRGVQRLLALSRTIADLAASESIEAVHLGEALQLRRPFNLQ
ncbi:MAG TPA: ATP-binding protein, partial [Steroidobacteraceae bacterium]|nr:ATP-binding protein [Steroidobacteraceae bacterium]